MRKLIIFIMIGMFISSCVEHYELLYSHYGEREKPRRLLSSVESGEAAPDAFVHAVKSGTLKLIEVSPEALANYLEAFANEGMLYWTPPEYFEHEEMKTSLEVVFEFHENIVMNRKVYERLTKM